MANGVEQFSITLPTADTHHLTQDEQAWSAWEVPTGEQKDSLKTLGIDETWLDQATMARLHPDGDLELRIPALKDKPAQTKRFELTPKLKEQNKECEGSPSITRSSNGDAYMVCTAPAKKTGHVSVSFRRFTDHPSNFVPLNKPQNNPWEKLVRYALPSPAPKTDAKGKVSLSIDPFIQAQNQFKRFVHTYVSTGTRLNDDKGNITFEKDEDGIGASQWLQLAVARDDVFALALDTAARFQGFEDEKLKKLLELDPSLQTKLTTFEQERPSRLGERMKDVEETITKALELKDTSEIEKQIKTQQTKLNETQKILAALSAANDQLADELSAINELDPKENKQKIKQHEQKMREIARSALKNIPDLATVIDDKATNNWTVDEWVNSVTSHKGLQEKESSGIKTRIENLTLLSSLKKQQAELAILAKQWAQEKEPHKNKSLNDKLAKLEKTIEARQVTLRDIQGINVPHPELFDVDVQRDNIIKAAFENKRNEMQSFTQDYHLKTVNDIKTKLAALIDSSHPEETNLVVDALTFVILATAHNIREFFKDTPLQQVLFLKDYEEKKKQVLATLVDEKGNLHGTYLEKIDFTQVADTELSPMTLTSHPTVEAAEGNTAFVDSWTLLQGPREDSISGEKILALSCTGAAGLSLGARALWARNDDLKPGLVEGISAGIGLAGVLITELLVDNKHVQGILGVGTCTYAGFNVGAALVPKPKVIRPAAGVHGSGGNIPAAPKPGEKPKPHEQQDGGTRGNASGDDGDLPE